MASNKTTRHVLNVTDQRLDTALSWLHGNAETLRLISRDAQITAAIGLLICDDAGLVDPAALRSAMGDRQAVLHAVSLLEAVLG